MYDLLKEFVKPELLILIPVLYLIGMGLKKSTVADKYIPLLLGGIGIVLSGLYVFATMGSVSFGGAVLALFTAITQGVLAAGASVFVNQIVKQAGKTE